MFLDFLRQAKSDFSYYSECQSEADKNVTDILHEFELNNDNLSDSDCAKLGRACGKARQQRRVAKDYVEVLVVVIDYIDNHPETQKQLERLLGDIRKIEKRKENRTYIPRGDIVKRTLKEVNDNYGAGECALETAT